MLIVSGTVCCPVGSPNRPPQRTASCPAEQGVVNRPVSADGTALGVALALAEAAGTVARMVGPFEPATAWHATNRNGIPRMASGPHRFIPIQTDDAVKGYKPSGRSLGQRVAQPCGVVGEHQLEQQNKPPYK